MNLGNSMKRENWTATLEDGVPRRGHRSQREDDDDSLTEVGEEHDFSLLDDADSEERRRDPLRMPH